MKKIDGKLHANGIRLAIVKSHENSFLTDHLLASAEEAYKRFGGLDEDLTCINVYSTADLCHVIKAIKGVDAIICLGAISPDEDKSYLQVLNMFISQYEIPVILGIADGNCLEDLVNKCGMKAGNIGCKAVQHAIELVNVLKQVN